MLAYVFANQVCVYRHCFCCCHLCRVFCFRHPCLNFSPSLRTLYGSCRPPTIRLLLTRLPPKHDAYLSICQGWGSFVGSIATMVVLAAYKHSMDDEGKVSRADGGQCPYFHRCLVLRARARIALIALPP